VVGGEAVGADERERTFLARHARPGDFEKITRLDEGAPDDSDVKGLALRGKTIIVSWKTVTTHDVFISARPTFKEGMRQMSEQPVFEWKLPEGKSLDRYLEGIITLSGYLTKEKSSAEEPEVGTGLESEIELARNIGALSGTHDLDERATRLVVRQHFKYNITLKNENVARLHPETLILELSEQKKRPTYEDSRLRLPPDIRLGVWRKLIETKEDVGEIPSLLIDAAKDLSPELAKNGVTYAQLSELAHLAVQLTATGESLQSWVEYREIRELPNLTNEYLRNEVRCRAKEGRAGWPIDYLVFGNDEGGALLALFGLEGNELALLVTMLLGKAQGNEMFSQEATHWLNALASSPLRENVPLQKKIEVAKTLNGQWKNLETMWLLYCGQEPATPSTWFIASDGEQRALHVELNQMVKTRAVGNAVPNLKGIIDLLGELSAGEVDALAELRPRLTWRSAGRWLEGWQTLNRPDVYQAEIVRLLVSNEDIPSDFSFESLDDQHRVAQVNQAIH